MKPKYWAVEFETTHGFSQWDICKALDENGAMNTAEEWDEVVVVVDIYGPFKTEELANQFMRDNP
jgi:hypothetical protein